MTNQDAIYILSGLRKSLHEYCGLNDNAHKAFNMAISALQAQEAKRSTYEQGEKMNRQRKVVITVTYNDLGVIVDTKAEELDSSAQPNLQPTCNQLATDTVSRTAAIDEIEERKNANGYRNVAVISELNRLEGYIMRLPSAQPEIVRCKDCKYGEQDEVGRWFCRSLGCQIGDEDGSGFCADAERRTDG